MKFAAFAVLLLAAAPAMALNIDIAPAHGESNNISDVSCGGIYNGIESQVTIKNSGNAGALCWYYTSENSERIKLTKTCIRKNDQPSYSFALLMPASGMKAVSVNMECYDFLENGNDTCQDDFDHDYAVNNKFTCANANGAGCLGRTLPQRNFNLSCEPIAFDAGTPNETLQLYNNQTAPVKISLTNTMTKVITCDQGIGLLGPNQTVYRYLQLTAPPNGSGNFSAAMTFTCTWSGGTWLSKSVNASASYGPHPCIDNIIDAQDSITGARSALASAENNMTAAKKAKINTTAAKNELNAAYRTAIDAESALRNARIACELGNVAAALQNATLAKQKAGEAINATGNALELLYGKLQKGLPYFGPTDANDSNNATSGNRTIIIPDNSTAITAADPELALIGGAAAAIIGIIILAAAGTRR